MSKFIFICFIFGIILSEPLILQFASRNPIDKDDVMKSLINNYIYTNFSVGSNNQQMEMNIRTHKSTTFLVSKYSTYNELAVKFNESESESYKKISDDKAYYSYEYNAAESKDIFRILQNNNKQIEIKDFEFMLVSKLWDSYQEYLGGMIGLRFLKIDNGFIYPPENTNFIYQLKEKKITNSSAFVLVYEDDFNGKLYIGNYFHQFNESYLEKDLISTSAGKNDWQINVEKILSGNTIIFNEATYLEIYYESGIIAAPEYYKEAINSTFFKDYIANNICDEKLNMENLANFDKYKYIVCKKNDFDKSSFPKLSFYNSEMNMSFILSHEDLFYEYEDKIYFLVIFPVFTINVKYWYIGKPFIKKYKLFLDEDKKTIGLYFNYTQYEEEKVQDEEQEKAQENEKAQEETKVQEQEKEKDQEPQNDQKQEKEKDQEETKVQEQEKEKDQEEQNDQKQEKEKDQEETKVQEQEKEKDQEEKNEQKQEKAPEDGQEQEKKNEKDKDDNEKPIKIIILIIGVVLIIVISALLYYFLIYKKFRKIGSQKLEDNTVEMAESEK